MKVLAALGSIGLLALGACASSDMRAEAQTVCHRDGLVRSQDCAGSAEQALKGGHVQSRNAAVDRSL